MKPYLIGGLLLAVVFSGSALAQSTNLTRAEVAAVKARLVAVQTALGGDPDGYVKESEDFSLPTEVSPNDSAKGRFWPISAGVSMTYTDRAAREGTENAEQAAKDLQAKYAAAIASGNPNAIAQMAQEATKLSGLALAAGLAGDAREDMDVDVQFNANPYETIDPDAVVFESPGVMALRDLSQKNRVTVFFDPVALAETETLSSFTLKTPDDGVSNRTGVYNITIMLTGAGEDLEAWSQKFDRAAILKLIDRE